METNRLKSFCTIAETGSMSKAAELLGVSHSGLSKSITVLQDETKLQLFRPHGRGLEITDQGKWFYKKALEILKIESEIAKGTNVPKLNLRIGLSEILAVTCASSFAKEFNKPLTILETDVGEVEKKLHDGSLDFGFTFSPSPQIDVDYQEIGSIAFNAFASVEYIKNKSIEQIQYTVPSSLVDFNPMGYKIRDGWPQNIPRTVHFQVSGFAIAMNLLRADLTAIYMPDFVADSEKNIVQVQQHAQAKSKRKLFLAKMKSSTETSDIKKASKVLRKLCL